MDYVSASADLGMSLFVLTTSVLRHEIGWVLSSGITWIVKSPQTIASRADYGMSGTRKIKQSDGAFISSVLNIDIVVYEQIKISDST